MADSAKRPFRRSVAIWSAAGVGVAVTSAVFYPGVMSPDSIGTYREAISSFDTGTSKVPLLAFMWRQVLRVAPGPGGLLVFQNLIFWGGLALIVSACRLGAVGAVLAIFGIGFFPPVFALLGILWNDVAFASFLTLSVGVALAGSARSSRALLVLAVVLLWAAVSLRTNALPAMMPLAAWHAVLWARASSSSVPTARRVLVTALVVSLLLFGVSRLTNAWVVVPGKSAMAASRWALTVALTLDLAGIDATSGDLRLPSYVRQRAPDLTLEGLRGAYDIEDANALIYGPRWSSDVWFTHTSEEFGELVGVWAGAIAAHPGTYLARRVAVLMSLFHVGGAVYYPFHTGIDRNDMGLTFNADPTYTRLTSWLYRTRGYFFRGWVFALVAVIVVAVGLRRHCWSAAAVCASGLAYVSTYAVISNGSDFRFIWWLVVSTLLGCVLLLFHRSPVLARPA